MKGLVRDNFWCLPCASTLFHFRNHLTFFSAHDFVGLILSPAWGMCTGPNTLGHCGWLKGKQMTSTGHWESGLGLWWNIWKTESFSTIIATAWSCWWPCWPLLGNFLREPWRRKTQRDTKWTKRRDQEGLISMTWFLHLNSDKPVVMLSLASFSKLFNYHSK